MLAIAIERDDSRPIYRQIEDHLRSAIRDRRLPPGTRLPSVRVLAEQLGVARITVANAYDDLVAEGFLTARVGRGTHVANTPPDETTRLSGAKLAIVGPWRSGPAAATGHNERRDIDLRPGPIGFDLFPTEIWGGLSTRAWRELRAEAPSRTDSSFGDPVLRRVLAAWVGVSRGVRADPDRIVVFSSVSAICAATARAILFEGSTAIIEDPGCPYFARALQTRHSRLVGVPVDGEGLMTEMLPESGDLLLVGPSWQYPVGGVMPMRRRREALDWARRTGAVIVEHDWAGPVRFDGGPLPAIQSLDANDRVIYAGGFAEVIPGLGMAFAVVPPGLMDRFTAAISMFESNPGLAEQRALAHFIAEGHFDSHLRRLRVALGRRREMLASAARHTLGDRAEVLLGPAGMQAVVRIADTAMDARCLIRRCQASGLALTPVSDFWLGTGPDDRFLIDYGKGRDCDMETAVGIISNAWGATPAAVMTTA